MPTSDLRPRRRQARGERTRWLEEWVLTAAGAIGLGCRGHRDAIDDLDCCVLHRIDDLDRTASHRAA